MIPLVTAFIAAEAGAVVGRHLTTGIDQPDIFDFARAAARSQFLAPKSRPFLTAGGSTSVAK